MPIPLCVRTRFVPQFFTVAVSWAGNRDPFGDLSFNRRRGDSFVKCLLAIEPATGFQIKAVVVEP